VLIQDKIELKSTSLLTTAEKLIKKVEKEIEMQLRRNGNPDFHFKHLTAKWT
jgi:hypothetical protein